MREMYVREHTHLTHTPPAYYYTAEQESRTQSPQCKTLMDDTRKLIKLYSVIKLAKYFAQHFNVTACVLSAS